MKALFLALPLLLLANTNLRAQGSAPCPGLLPGPYCSPDSAEEISDRVSIIETTLAAISYPQTVCTALYYSSWDPTTQATPRIVFLDWLGQSNQGDCPSSTPDVRAVRVIEHLVMTSGIREGYWVGIISPNYSFEPQIVEVMTLKACCLVPYRDDANAARLRISGSTSSGSNLQVDLENFQSADAIGRLLVSRGPGFVSLQSGTLLVSRSQLVLKQTLHRVGEGPSTFSLPPDPSLIGTTFYCQAVLVDPTGNHLPRFTNGVMLTIQ